LRLAVAFAVALVLLAHPGVLAASDVFSNIAPQPQVTGGLFGEYPLGNYALDSHFSAVSVGLFSGVDVSGVPPMIAFFLANTIWQLTAFLANTVITLFTFAFSLDLLNGSTATGGAGALAPVSAAVASIYHSVFGEPWLVVAIVAAGLWAMWKALVQRRYTETAGALALSTVYVIIALLFVTEPQRTIGTASRWTNELSAAFLSLTNQGTLNNEQQAKQADADQLFHLLVYQPWVVLQFGGLQHCVTDGSGSTPRSVPVQPLSQTPAQNQTLSQQLQAGSEIQAPGKTCVNNANKYAAHFLAYPSDSTDRNSEYQALADGKTSELPASDPTKTTGYQLGPVDQPAADAMGKDGQYQRLLLALVVFVGELGAFLLLGALSVGVILAQIIVLLLLAFAPVALVIAVFPGRGHDYFRGWLARLATFLLRKAIYSLVLAVLLAVAAALTDATASLGWLLSFGLEATFFWTVFLYRHQLTGALTQATTGHNPARDPTAKLASLYYATRLASRHHNPPTTTFPSAATPPPAEDDPRGDPDAPPASPSQSPPEPHDAPLAPAYLVAGKPQLAEAPAHDHGPHRAQPQQRAPEGAARPVAIPNADEPAPTTGARESSGASDSPRSATHTSTQQPTRPADGAADREEPARPATPAIQLPAKPRRAGERPVTRETTREAETEISLAEGVHRNVEHQTDDQPSFDHTDPLIAGDESAEGL
jgi:hypothetical protein